MTGDLPAAAARLLATLPVRTHYQAQHQARPDERTTRGYIIRRTDQRGPAGIPRPVRVDGRTYPSITVAKTKLHISPKRLYHWLDTGRAVYI